MYYFFPMIKVRDAALTLMLATFTLATPCALASIGTLSTANDATTVTYQYAYSSPTSTERQLYLDTDQRATTGFTIAGTGADFLLANGNLYKYTGTGGYNWSWRLLRQVSYEDNVNSVKWVIARSLLGWPAGIRVIGKVNRPVEVTNTVTQAFATSFAPLQRDPLKWPFASTSIWNMPIGSNAVYVPANLPAVPSNDPWCPMPQADVERIVLRPEAVRNNIVYNGAAWTGANRCTLSSTVLGQVSMPDEYMVPNDRTNSGAAFLEPDGRTIIQSQPLARCTHGTPGTGLGMFAPVDLYGNGITGAHGGSGMSVLGGTLRMGELRPGGTGPRHALKLDVDPAEVLYRCTTMADCFRWPAKTADALAVGLYGINNPNVSLAMKMGALLAIPAHVDLNSLNLETEPARQMAWTLQNYGMYIVDVTTGAAYVIATEDGVDGAFTRQFLQDWGFPFEQRVRDNTPWVRDMQRMLTALHVVDNNTAATPGGGGTPLQPLAPPLP